MNRGALSYLSFIGSSKRPPIKKVATPKNAKELPKKTTDKKRGNPKKCKGAHQKDLR
jgi:hypothetical protein